MCKPFYPHLPGVLADSYALPLKNVLFLEEVEGVHNIVVSAERLGTPFSPVVLEAGSEQQGERGVP